MSYVALTMTNRLWAAVLYRLLRDTLSRSDGIRRPAIEYLTGEEEDDLRTVCELAGVEIGGIQAAARKLRDLGPARGKDLLKKLVGEEHVSDN